MFRFSLGIKQFRLESFETVESSLKLSGVRLRPSGHHS